MEESRKIGESIHKILELDDVVSGGLVLKLYEDLFNPNTSNSNFLQALYYFLGRGKRLGYLTEEYDLYIDGDMVYNYYTPQQAELFNSVKVDILNRYQTAKIKTEKEDTVPLKDYHKLEKDVSDLVRVKKALVRKNKRIQRKNLGLLTALVSLLLVTFFGSVYFYNKLITLSKANTEVQVLEPQTSKLDDLFTSKSRESLKDSITKEYILDLKETLTNAKYPEEDKSKDLGTLDSLLTYFDVKDKLVNLAENSSPISEYLKLKDTINSVKDSNVRSILYSYLVDSIKDKSTYDSVIAELNEYPTDDEVYQRLESQINGISSASPKLKESALEYFKEVKEVISPQNAPLEE